MSANNSDRNSFHGFLFAIISAREKHSSLLLSQFTVNVSGSSGSPFYVFRCCRCLSINALCEKSKTSIAPQSCRLFTQTNWLSACTFSFQHYICKKKKEKKLLWAGQVLFKRVNASSVKPELAHSNVHYKFTHLCGIIQCVHDPCNKVGTAERQVGKNIYMHKTKINRNLDTTKTRLAVD